MGNTEIEKILEFVEKLYHDNEILVKEYEKKMYANKEMAIEDRVHYTIKYCECNTLSITLRQIISMIKSSVEMQKFVEEKRQEQETTNKEFDQAQSHLDNKDIMRKELLVKLKGLIKWEQGNAITTLETSLGDRGIKDKEIYQIYKYRLEGVIHVINETEYYPETNRKIAEIIHKLYENKIL
jgi:hypothetical protein